MDPERWREVEAVADGALVRPASERAGWIVDRCGGDRELLREVLDLLLAAGEADDLPTPGLAGSGEGPGREAQERSAESEAPRAGFGAFRPVRALGHGGMGTVWLAEQTEPVSRRVALKVIRAALPGREDRRRLEAERRALARLQHPGVAALHEAGTTDDGQPYFVMEWVDGPPITTWSDRHRLGTRARLDLFLAVCDGVRHAHQKGVLHRDLKPSNVLVAEVDGRPTPKLIDFGIAEILDRPARDAAPDDAGRILGTPAYLAPEVLDGRPADTRTDVYSLGVLLRELLVGREPDHDGRPVSWERLRRRAREEAVPPSAVLARLPEEERRERAACRGTDPVRLARALRGDLDGIVLRALASDPDERYPGVGELASDVVAHLADEPVTAGPSDAVHRLRKLLRRRRAPLAAAALVVLTLVGGFVARTLEARRANREAARADLRATEAREAAGKARAAREEADEVVGFLVDLLSAPDPGRALGEEPTLREVLDRAGEAAAAGGLEERPEVRARILETVALVQRKLGRYREALALVEEALAIRRGHQGENHPATGRAWRLAGMMEMFLGRSEAAGDRLERALSILEADPALDPIEVANTHQLLGIVAAHLGRQEESLERFRAELAAKERALGTEHPDLAPTLNNVAVVHQQLGRLSEASEALRRALALLEVGKAPDHPDALATRQVLATVLRDRGRLDEARALFERVLADEERVLGTEHPTLAETLVGLGYLLVATGEWVEAEAVLRRALAVRAAELGDEHRWQAYATLHLGWAALGQGRFAEAEEAFARAERVRSSALGSGDPGVAEARILRAEALRWSGREHEAADLLASAAAILDAAPGVDAQDRARLRAQRGWLHLAGGRPGAAAEDLRAAWSAAAGEAVVPLGPIRGLAAHGLARLASAGDDAEAAAKWRSRAEESFAASLPSGHPYRQALDGG